jgi:hypothetical protein
MQRMTLVAWARRRLPGGKEELEWQEPVRGPGGKEKLEWQEPVRKWGELEWRDELALMPSIFPLGFLARGGGETDSSGSMGGRMDKSQRRADGDKGYSGFVGEILEEDSQWGVENQRDFIAECNGRGGGGGQLQIGGSTGTIDPREIGPPSSKKGSWLAGDR